MELTISEKKLMIAKSSILFYVKADLRRFGHCKSISMFLLLFSKTFFLNFSLPSPKINIFSYHSQGDLLSRFFVF